MPRTRTTTTRSATRSRGAANGATALQRYRSARDSQAQVSAVADTASWTVTPGDGNAEAAIETVSPPALGWPFPPVPWSGIYRQGGINWPLPPLPVASAEPAPPAGQGQQPDAADGMDGAAAEASPPAEAAAAGFPFRTEELRVDVDGLFPTMTVSGTISGLFIGHLTWIARVTRQPNGAYTGAISYRDGNAALRPHANVSVTLHGLPFLPPFLRYAKARFTGGPAPDVVLHYGFTQAHFRDVAFEYDTVSDATSVTSYNPTSHPNHPPTVPNTTLSLESAYARLGIRVTKTGGDSAVPIAGAGPNTTWSDQEMHDAMEAHWSRWKDAPQWAVWVLFARLHDMGTGLGGIMFDDIGTAQRQGCAIFSESFISQAPAGEANPGPWVQRMRFWTAAHEIGHTFNLAHSWQKSLGTPWVPLADEPAALSYMNYPYNYPGGGTDTFFAAFEFGFSPDELLFLRHAPERFVQQGNELWFVNHAFEHETFEQLRANTSGALELEARVHREPRYEFLEPVLVELRLKNTSSTACIVDANALTGDGVAIIVQKNGSPPPAVRRAAAEGAGARGGDLRTGVPFRFDLRLAHQRARQLPDLRCGADRKRHGAEPAAADHGRSAGQPGSRAAGRGRVHPADRAHHRFRRIARAGRGQRHPARRCQRAARLPAGRARPGRAGRPDGHRWESAGAVHGRIRRDDHPAVSPPARGDRAALRGDAGLPGRRRFPGPHRRHRLRPEAGRCAGRGR